MAIEATLGSGVIGAVLLQPVLLTPMIGFLLPLGLGIIALIGLIVVVPLFIFIPRFWRTFYNARTRIEAFWLEYSRDWMGIAGVVIIAAIVFIGLFADVLAPFHWGYSVPDISTYFLPPGPIHLLGTNNYGQDIFSRLLYGARISLLVGFSASLIAVGIGTSVGLLAGYFGGVIDIVLMRITDVFLSLPTLPLMLVFLAILGQGLWNIIIVIAILGWTGTARMVRSETLSLRERPLTEAAHAIGASDIWIITRHILPNVLPLVLANMILGVVNAILSEAGITFLGFGNLFGEPSWGIILHFASTQGALINGSWWWFIPPGVFILLTALGFAFASHSADKVVNPRLRRRRK
jgi:ABC-type dipeptide/oligopeptide/nickel transport system permease subunit